MRGSLTLTLFALIVGVWGENAGMQADSPAPFETVERQVTSLLEAMKNSFGEMANRRNSWYDRYDQLASDASNHSTKIFELLSISRVAMPIIWTTYEASLIRHRQEALSKYGEEFRYTPPDTANGERVPHPLRNLPMKLTDQNDFTVSCILRTIDEVNIGIRLMFEPEDGQDFDWDNDDILLGVHLRWHFDYGPSREISVHEKYDGEFIRSSETITPEAHWPNIKVGEKFTVIIQKKGKCFEVYSLLGKDQYGQEQFSPPYIHKFCQARRRTAKMISDPKRLRLVINEDKQRTGGVQVHTLSWYPNIAL